MKTLIVCIFLGLGIGLLVNSARQGLALSFIGSAFVILLRRKDSE